MTYARLNRLAGASGASGLTEVIQVIPATLAGGVGSTLTNAGARALPRLVQSGLRVRF